MISSGEPGGAAARRQGRWLILFVAVSAVAAVVVAALLRLMFLWLLRPAVPVVGQATPEAVVGFLANSRGMAALSAPEQQNFLYALVDHYVSKEQREQLARALDALTAAQRTVVRDAVFGAVKEQVLADAREFRAMPDERARRELLDSRVEQYDRLRRWLAGGKGMPDLTKSLSEGLGDSDEMTRYVLSRTTPREQELAQEFLEALAKRAVISRMHRALEGALSSQPAAAPSRPEAASSRPRAGP